MTTDIPQTTLDRLEDLARRNLAAQKTYEAHMRGVPLPECLINLAEALAANGAAMNSKNDRESQTTPCRWCGTVHGTRCPSVAALEFHPGGAVKRVEFVQPTPIPIDYSQVKIGPTGLVPDGRGGYRIGGSFNGTD